MGTETPERKYTGFPEEKLLIFFIGEVLVQARTSFGLELIAVSDNGFNTDYPKWENSKVVRWDNPEYFSEEFKKTVNIYITCKQI